MDVWTSKSTTSPNTTVWWISCSTKFNKRQRSEPDLDLGEVTKRDRGNGYFHSGIWRQNRRGVGHQIHFEVFYWKRFSPLQRDKRENNGENEYLFIALYGKLSRIPLFLSIFTPFYIFIIHYYLYIIYYYGKEIEQ